MTRKSLNRKLRLIYVLFAGVLALALAAKLGPYVPEANRAIPLTLANDIYEFLRDMAVLIITVAAAYLANVFQKRSAFVDSLRHEWRAIVRTKSALIAFCDKQFPTTEDYLAAYRAISEAIDNMRIVYRNVGETDSVVGLYPYAPLHDMRRALMTLDPRQTSKHAPPDRELVKDAVLQTFYALRENFLDELDLEEPTAPLTASVSRRMKKSGTTNIARRGQKRQIETYEQAPSPRPDVDALLSDLYYREQAADHARAQKSGQHVGDTIPRPQAPPPIAEDAARRSTGRKRSS